MNDKKLKLELRRLGIENVREYAIETNSAQGLPYHNSNHLNRVAMFALMGAEYYGLSNEEKKLILTAAFFHDYNHTGSGKNDDVNITEAVKGFIQFNRVSQMFSKREAETIVKLIECTRYPYQTYPEHLTLSEKILRDSDILQNVFVDDYINDTVLAIAKESSIPEDKMIDMQENFLRTLLISFCTEWASNLLAGEYENTIQKVKNYQQR